MLNPIFILIGSIIVAIAIHFVVGSIVMTIAFLNAITDYTEIYTETKDDVRPRVHRRRRA